MLVINVTIKGLRMLYASIKLRQDIKWFNAIVYSIINVFDTK